MSSASSEPASADLGRSSATSTEGCDTAGSDEPRTTIIEIPDVCMVQAESGAAHYGTLRIVERFYGRALMWVPLSRQSCVAAAGDRQVEDDDDAPRALEIDICELASLRLTDAGRRCVIVQRDGTTSGAFQFAGGGQADVLLDMIHSVVPIQRSCRDDSLYLVDDQTASPARRGPRRQQHHPLHDISAFTEHSIGSVWKFMRQFPQDPRAVALTGLGRLAESFLNIGLEEERPEEDLAELLRAGAFSGEPLTPPPRLQSTQQEGFEVVTEIHLGDEPAVPRLPPLSDAELQADFVPLLPDERRLRERVFRGGVEPELRPMLWRHLLGCERLGLSADERREGVERRRAEYARMKLQWSSVSDDQLSRFSGLRERRAIVEKDVARTDRSIPFYSGSDNQNLVTLHDILLTYCMFNFDLGYVQGMSDLLSPLLYVLDDEADAFWCFVGFMARLEDNFELSQQGMERQFSSLHALLQVYDPTFCAYLDRNESARMSFTFRWMLVWFKRELMWSDVLRLWEVLWTGWPCSGFPLLVALSVLVQQRHTVMESQLGFSAIVKYVNDLAMCIDLEQTLVLADQIYRQFRSGSRLPLAVTSILALPAQTDDRQPQHEHAPPEQLLERDYEAALTSNYI